MQKITKKVPGTIEIPINTMQNIKKHKKTVNDFHASLHHDPLEKCLKFQIDRADFDLIDTFVMLINIQVPETARFIAENTPALHIILQEDGLRHHLFHFLKDWVIDLLIENGLSFINIVPTMDDKYFKTNLVGAAAYSCKPDLLQHLIDELGPQGLNYKS